MAKIEEIQITVKRISKMQKTVDYSDRRSLQEYNANTRVYIWPEGETVIDNLMNRKSRPYNIYKKEIMPEVLKELGLDPEMKVRWSRYAGCSCPCSPGFILPMNLGYDVHVTIG